MFSMGRREFKDCQREGDAGCDTCEWPDFTFVISLDDEGVEQVELIVFCKTQVRGLLQFLRQVETGNCLVATSMSCSLHFKLRLSGGWRSPSAGSSAGGVQ